MNADDLVALMRKGEGKLRLDELVLDAGTEKFKGRGMLIINRDQIVVEMIVLGESTPPEAKAGIYTIRDCWQLTGLIDEELEFKCDRVFPCYGLSITNEKTRYAFDISELELIPSGWDALTTDERDDLHKETMRRAAIEHPHLVSQPLNLVKREQPSPITAEFHAVLSEFPLLVRNSSTQITEKNSFIGETYSAPSDMFRGEIDGLEYALIKDRNKPDLHVHARSTTGVISVSEAADLKKFRALLNALAFVHGIHAWPHRLEYWRAGRRVSDRVKCAHRLARTSHIPFSEGLAFHLKQKGITWDLSEPIRLMAAFLEQDTKLSREVGELLARFREADDVKHPELTVLALCTLLENLIHLIFKERNLEPWARKEFPEVKQFEEAKQELLEHVELQIPLKGEGYSRMKNLLSHAQAFYIGEKFEAVVRHLDLKWEDDFARLAKAWKKARNDLVHEAERMDMTEDEIKKVWLNESFVAGMINVLVLKLIGYSGPMRFSQQPEEYRRI